MDSLRTLRLVVRIPDLQEASYPLELGRYSLGASRSCMIHVEGSGIGDIHAYLCVDPAGFTIESLSPSLLLNGNPITGIVPLRIGDKITAGKYEVFLKELDKPAVTATRNLSEGAQAIMNDVLLQLRRGLPGYDDVLRMLTRFISPNESESARNAFLKGKYAFLRAALVLTCLQLGTALLPAASPNYAAVLYDLSAAAFLIVSLILVSCYRVSIAGRLLIPLLWLLRFYEPPMMDWYLFPGALRVIGYFLEALTIGVLLDFGASSEPGRGMVLLRRLALIGVGWRTAYIAIGESKGLQGWWLGFTVAAGVICAFWTWAPGPWLERRSRLGKQEIPDAEIVRLIGMRLWSRVTLGRILAICLGALPALLLFHSFQIEDRLKWPEPGEEALMTSKPKRVWFWKQEGRLFLPSDLKSKDENSHLFYGFSGQSEQFMGEILEAEQDLRYHPDDPAAYEKLKSLLEPYRIRTAGQLKDILSRQSHETEAQQPSLYYLENDPLRPRGPFQTPARIYSGGDQLRFLSIQFEGYTQEEIKVRELNSYFRRFLLIFCGALGLMILWRRGGDWGLAFWLGLWLLGAATLGAFRYSLLFIPTVTYHIWQEALTSSGFNLLFNIFIALYTLSLLSIMFFVTFLPCAAVWAWICWPTDSESWRQRFFDLPQRFLSLTIAKYVPLVAGKILAVTLAMCLLFWGSLWLLSTLQAPAEVAQSTAGALFVGISFLAGVWSYRKHLARGKRLDSLNLATGFLFLAIQAIALLTAPERINSPAFRTFLCALILLFAVFLLFLVIKRGFLRLFSLRDATVIATAFTTLLFIRISEELFLLAIEILSHGARIPEAGAKVLAVLAAMVIIPRLHHGIEKLFLHLSFIRIRIFPRPSFSIKRLRNIEHRVGKALELLIDTRDPKSLGQVQKALSACNVRRYAFFARRGKVDFESSALCRTRYLPDQIRISRTLLKFLASQKTPIDLTNMAFDWRFFFFQFEIERLKELVPGHYLLPVLLGESVRGLLFLFDVKEERALGEEQVANGLVDLGLLTTQLRYQHSIPP